jgi:exopolysaccharide biosynthesis polyprenyl glycosylphosphotransferase
MGTEHERRVSVTAERTRDAIRVRRSAWQRDFAYRLFTTDLIVVVVSVGGSQLLWFGLDTPAVSGTGSLEFGFTALSVLLATVWMLVLAGFATRDRRIVGTGTLEYKRVADATIRLFGGFGIIAYLLQIGLARGFFLTALPVGLGLLILSRWLWRQWLRDQQAAGAYLSRAILVGARLNAIHVAETIRKTPGTGIDLIGAFTRGGTTSDNLHDDIPVLGSFNDILSGIDEHQVDSLILTGADEIGPNDMRQLGWDLGARDVELIVAPALTDVAGPRIHSRPVAGLPLIHVEYPRLEGPKRLTKRLFDIVASSVLIVIAAIPLLIVAIAIKMTSPGKLIYKQERVGRLGEPFGMLKFRSMVADADDQLESLLDAQGTSDTPLFKVINDPRITPVGRFIRKYSIDEFPQLFNVLLGQMSLVGPRPQRAAEVALYDDAAHRRLIMKPGMSGLWQVSGRSNLSWEDAIRLDLYYVENWSMTADILILFRTIRAVVKPSGAV